MTSCFIVGHQKFMRILWLVFFGDMWPAISCPNSKSCLRLHVGATSCVICCRNIFQISSEFQHEGKNCLCHVLTATSSDAGMGLIFLFDDGFCCCQIRSFSLWSSVIGTKHPPDSSPATTSDTVTPSKSAPLLWETMFCSVLAGRTATSVGNPLRVTTWTFVGSQGSLKCDKSTVLLRKRSTSAGGNINASAAPFYTA